VHCRYKIAHMISQVFSLITFIMSNDSPKQIGWAIAIAFLFALMPGFNLIHLAILLIVYLFMVHLPSFFIFSLIFKIINFQIVIWAHNLGLYLLKMEALNGIWTTLYNTPIFPFTKFNNTAVLGGLILGVFLLYPIQLLSVKGILLYREKYQAKVNAFFEKIWIVKVIKASNFYKLFLKYSEKYAELRKVL